MILILHGRLVHTARMWWARWNLALWHQNLGLKPLHPITLFQKWMRLIVLLKENTIRWKEGGDCSCTVWGDDAYGSVERDIRSRFWLVVSALQRGMKTQQIAEYLFGSGNWIESQIFYLSVLFNWCIVSLQHLYLEIQLRQNLAKLGWSLNTLSRMGSERSYKMEDPPKLWLSLNQGHFCLLGPWWYHCTALEGSI